MDVTTSKAICFVLCLFVYNKLGIDVRICFRIFRWFKKISLTVVFLNTSFYEDEARNHINLGLLCEQF